MSALKNAVPAARKAVLSTLDAGKRAKKTTGPKNLFEVLGSYDNWGVGATFTRTIWARYPEQCYWTVTRVKPTNLFLPRGKAWGVLTWRGVTETRERPVRGLLKRQWRPAAGVGADDVAAAPAAAAAAAEGSS